MRKSLRKSLPAIVGAFAVIAAMGGAFSLVQAQSGTAFNISDINISNVTSNSATVTWDTDVNADSMINFGLTPQVGIVRDPIPTESHQLILTELDPGTLYHFRVVSVDPSGNQVISGDKTLTTATDENVITKKVVELIKQIQQPQNLQKVVQAVTQQAQQTVQPPAVIGVPHIDELGDTYAVIRWGTDQNANSVVELATDGDYNPQDPMKYTGSQGNLDESVTAHTVKVTGLIPGTLYHFRASSENALGLKGLSDDGTFTTKSELPVISNINLDKVEADSATISWSTNIPASGFVLYKDLTTRAAKTAGSEDFTTHHSVHITALTLGTVYQATITAQNKTGDKVTSPPKTFRTVKDTTPPVISQVNNQSTLYPTDDVKIQTVISWNTDEPAQCAVSYRQGLGTTGDPRTLPLETNLTVTHTAVVTEFQPATAYKFWINCTDGSGNSGQSDDFVLFTPDKEKSIIDIIIENFGASFGWIKNIGKKS